MKKRIGSVLSAILFMLVIIVMSTTLVFAAGTKLKITKQPVSVKTLVGYQAKVSVSAEGEGLTYKWYEKDTDENEFTRNKSFKSNSYSVKMQDSVNGRKVYCVIKDKNGKSVQTKTVTLKKGAKVKITEQPVSVSAPKDMKAKVTVKTKGDGLTYKWYYKDAGASGYTYTKTYKSNTYTVKMNKKRDGRKVYCIITDKYGNSVRTEVAALTLGTTLKITKQPKSDSASCGKKVKVTVKAKGDGLTYKWYYKEAGASKYKYTKSYTGKTYSVKMNSKRDGRMIYCVITDKYGKSVKTKAVTLSANHDFNKGKVTEEATCIKEGKKVYTCKDCSFKKTETLAKTSHKMGSWKVYRESTVALEGVERRYCKNCSYYKDRSIAKLKAVYYITVKTGTGSATKVGVANDGKYSLATPTRAGYNFKGWQTSKGETFENSGVYKDNITVNAVWELDGTNTLAELIERTDAGVDRILITGNITVNKTLFISGKTKIYSDGDYSIIRATNYAGDIFVVGRDRNGKIASVNQRKAELTLGGGKGTLTIDGNRDKVNVNVVGSAILISNSSVLNIYDGVKIANNKKSGNDRIFDIDFSSVETLERAGGAAILSLNSTVNMYGGVIENNGVNTEYTIIENEDGTKTYKEAGGCGGAIYNRGNFNMYGGTVTGNEALRGGGIYSDRIVYLEAGTVSDNIAYAYGGGFSSSSSANADTHIGTENGTKNMVFSGNRCVGVGGAVYSNTSSPIMIYGNAIFENNVSEASGGAIHTAGPLTIRDTEFIGNKCEKSGGAIYHYYTKATFERRLLTIDNCKFENNSGNLGGAIILSASDAVAEKGIGTYGEITNSQFINNHAVESDGSAGNAGAIYITRKSEAIIENCSFTGNTSVNNAGAIAVQSSSKAKLTDVTFADNSAVTGGALYTSGGNSVKMKNIQFKGNSAVLNENNSGGNGGAVYIYESDVTFDNIDFYDNLAANHAGAVYLSVSDINIDSTCEFTGNSAGNHGGAFYLTYKTDKDGTKDGAVLNAVDVNFENNTAMAGGAISARTACTANLTGVKLIGNSVTGDDGKNDGNAEGGGAIYVGYGTLTMNNVTATGNSSYSNGGAVNALKSDVSIKNVSFTDNKSDSNGGALFVSSDNDIETSDITFMGNAAANGGAMYIGSGSAIDMTNIAFNGNKAKSNGGAVCIFSSKVTVNNVDMTENSADNHAGALYLNATELNIDSTCDFVGNSAGNHGGAIYLVYKKTDNGNVGAILNATDVTFENNTALGGGAISARTACEANLTGVKLIGNSANGYADENDGDGEGGGAIYVGFGSATLTNVTATGNTASDFGGVIDAVSADVTVTGGTFSGNKTKSGGVIFARTKSDVTFTGSVLNENESTYIQTGTYNGAIGGGAICTDGGKLTIADTSLTSNKSGYYGGAVHTTGTTVDISGNTVVTGNTGSTGAALYFRGSSKVTMDGTTVTDNTSKGNGVIYHNGGTLDITNLTATGNKGGNGGVFYISGSTKANIKDSLLSGNEAGTGGVMYMSDATVTVSGCDIKENNASGGGAVYNRKGIYNSDSVSYTANTATNHGGAVSLAGGTANISPTDTFTGNSATNHGGAVYVSYYDEKVTVDNTETTVRNPGILNANGSTFTENTATGGGAISIRSASEANIESATFTGNYVSGYENSDSEAGKNDGVGEGGGSIYVGYGSLSLKDVTATDNTASDFGGVIDATGATVTVTGGTFSTNSAKKGGVIYAVNDSDVTFDGSTVIKNTASSEGGFVNANNGKLDIKNASVSENEATGNGGAVYVYKNATTLENVKFTSNKSSVHGGAVCISASEVTAKGENEFRSNTAVKHGGAVYITYTGKDENRISGVLKMTDGLFEGNTALAGGAVSARTSCVAEIEKTKLINNSVDGYADENDGDGEGGGAIYVGFGSVTLVDVTATGNTATDFGGVIDAMSATVTVTGGTFSGNTTNSGGVIFARSGSDVSFSGSVLSGNESSYIQTGTYNGAIGGGAICIDGGKLTIADATLDSNESGYYGGAVHTTGTTVDIIGNTVITGNTGSTGAALYFRGGSKVTMNGTTVTGNTSKGNGVVYQNGGTLDITGLTATGNKGNSGGVFFISGGGTVVNIKDSVCSGNTANSGGVIYMTDATVTVSGSEFKENTAKSGGTVYNRTGTYNSDSVSYSANTASGSGGAVLLSGGTANIGAEDTFTSNAATEHGGAIYVTYYENTDTKVKTPATLVANGGTFISNEAGINGGAVYIVGSEANITGECEFSSNSAVNHGGAIYVNYTGKAETLIPGVLNMTGGVFEENTAIAGGAVSVRSNCVAELNGTKLIGNSVSGYYVDGSGAGENDGDCEGGGAIYVGYGTLKLTDVTATGNTASDFGGVIDAAGADVTVTGGTFSGNSTKKGGVIYAISGSDVTFDGSTVSKNIASEGGGFANTSGSALTIKNTNVTENEATGNGGAVYVYKNAISLDGAKFTSNKAGGHGGAVDIVGAELTATGDCEFKGNTAVNHGGAIYVTYSGKDETLVGSVMNMTGGLFEENSALAGGAISSRTGGNVTLTGTELRNNTATGKNSGEGGGAIFTNNNTLTLSGVVMDGNSSAYYGGAITSLGAEVTVKDNSRIIGSKGITGVALNLRDSGDDGSVCTLNGVSVTDNEATSNGSGVIYITGKGTLNLNDVTASGNKNNNGGVIYASGSTTVNVENSELSGNTALSNGGAIFVADATVTATVSGSEVKENTAKHGGAVYNRTGTYSSDGVSYSTNISSGNGGAISTAGGTVNISATDNFSSNSTTGHGGAIYVSYQDIENADKTKTRIPGVLTANGGTFTDNNALAGGAISVRSNCTAELDGTTLENNSVSGYHDPEGKGETENDGNGEGGGAIYVGYGTLKLTDVTATGNTASDFGGAVDSVISTVEITGGIFSGNSTKNGGALYIMDTSVVTIKDTRFENNTASSKGGAISTDTSSVNLAINAEGCTFEGNKATGAGAGAVEIQNGNCNSATDPTEVKIVFKDCSFIGNSAKTTGGAVEIRSSSCAKFDGITATGNKANANGGVIYVTSNYSRIYLTGDVVLSDNSTGETGEFIHLYKSTYSNPPKLYTTHSSSADWYTTALIAGNRDVAFDMATLP